MTTRTSVPILKSSVREAEAPSKTPDAPAEARRLMAALRSSLENRCDILMRVASPDVRQSDAPRVVEALRLLEGDTIRQPPLAAQRALAVARNSVSSAAQLVAIFEQDPALAEELLRTANSHYYQAGREPCLSIGAAIQRVGVRGIEAIVTMNTVEGMLCRPGSAYAPILDQVWAHLKRSAQLSRSLAPGFGVAPETAFTVGLLHDLGKLAVFDHLTELRTRLRREIKMPERFLFDLLNRLHEPIGGIAALRWGLGEDVAAAIASHHREPPPDQPNTLSELLCLAERVDHAIRTRMNVDLERFGAEVELTIDLQRVRPFLERVEGLKLLPPDSPAELVA